MTISPKTYNADDSDKGDVSYDEDVILNYIYELPNIIWFNKKRVILSLNGTEEVKRVLYEYIVNKRKNENDEKVDSSTSKHS